MLAFDSTHAVFGQIKQPTSAQEHAAHLRHPDEFDSLHRKNDFLAEGVHTVFGIKDGEAELQGFFFQANLFTPAEAKLWLQERVFEPLGLRRTKGCCDYLDGVLSLRGCLPRR
jgi:hypothetical protein